MAGGDDMQLKIIFGQRRNHSSGGEREGESGSGARGREILRERKKKWGPAGLVFPCKLF